MQLWACCLQGPDTQQEGPSAAQPAAMTERRARTVHPRDSYAPAKEGAARGGRGKREAVPQPCGGRGAWRPGSGAHQHRQTPGPRLRVRSRIQGPMSPVARPQPEGGGQAQPTRGQEQPRQPPTLGRSPPPALAARPQRPWSPPSPEPNAPGSQPVRTPLPSIP